MIPVVTPQVEDETMNVITRGPLCDTHELFTHCQRIKNFRPVPGSPRLFRCAAPDTISHTMRHPSVIQRIKESLFSWPEAEQTVLCEATLIIDLRMDDEVDEDLSISDAISTVQDLNHVVTTSSKRVLYRPNKENGFTKSDLNRYIIQAWITKETWDRTDPCERESLVLKELNTRGLHGLYEILLEKKTFVCNILQAITLHLEQRRDGKVVFHCSLGKDRTGIIAMLCAHLLGARNEDILDDFAESSCMEDIAIAKFTELFRGRIDSATFACSKPESMRLTVQYIREKYGSIEIYLVCVGFDRSWQNRFIQVAS